MLFLYLTLLIPLAIAVLFASSETLGTVPGGSHPPNDDGWMAPTALTLTQSPCSSSYKTSWDLHISSED